MAFDNHTNFGVSTVAVLPSPAASGTALTVASGEGVRFPAAPFNCTITPIAAQPTPANAEIVRVTARTGDVFTLARAQEGTTARMVQLGDLIAATITAATLTDIETRAALKDVPNVFASPQRISHGTLPTLEFAETGQPVDARLFRIVGANQLLAMQVLTDAGAPTQNALILDRLGNAKVASDLYEKSRPTPMGHWTDLPPTLTSQTGTVTVTANNACRYTLVGRTIIVSFYLTVTLSATPLFLTLALPAGITTANYGIATFNIGSGPGMAQAILGGTVLNLYRDMGALIAWATGANTIGGTLAFQIT